MNSDARLISVNPVGTAVVFAAQRFDRTDYAQILIFSLVNLTTIQITSDGGGPPFLEFRPVEDRLCASRERRRRFVGDECGWNREEEANKPVADRVGLPG